MLRNMKKWLGPLLAFLLLPVAGAFAQPDLTVGNGTGLAGQTVNTDVSFTNNGAVVTTSFDITYNPALVTPGTPTASATLAPHTLASSTPAAGVLRVQITPPIVLPLPTMNSGTLFTVPWTIAATAASGNTPLTLANAVFGNAAAQAVAPGTLTSGQITVTAVVAVPNTVGLTQAAAEAALTSAGLVVAVTPTSSATVPAGQVISQNPPAGTNVAAGSTVNLSVSSGPPPAPPAGTATIPTLSEWALLLLGLALGGLIWRNRARRAG